MNLLVEYCRLLTTPASLCPFPRSLSSVDWLGPIKDARSGGHTDMHAIGGVLDPNNPGTDAGK